MKNKINQLQSTDAERSVIGSLLLDNAVFDRVSDSLTPSDFFHVPHQIIYKHIEQLAQNGQPFDVVTLSDSMQVSKTIDQVGGLGYLAEIAKDTPTSQNITAYADIVKNKSIKRKLSQALFRVESVSP